MSLRASISRCRRVATPSLVAPTINRPQQAPNRCASAPDYSQISSRVAGSRCGCAEKDDMAAPYKHVGQYVSTNMALFDEAGERLTAPQQVARE